jgi:hypothetical protein
MNRFLFTYEPGLHRPPERVHGSDRRLAWDAGPPLFS